MPRTVLPMMDSLMATPKDNFDTWHGKSKRNQKWLDNKRIESLCWFHYGVFGKQKEKEKGWIRIGKNHRHRHDKRNETEPKGSTLTETKRNCVVPQKVQLWRRRHHGKLLWWKKNHHYCLGLLLASPEEAVVAVTASRAAQSSALIFSFFKPRQVSLSSLLARNQKRFR